MNGIHTCKAVRGGEPVSRSYNPLRFYLVLFLFDFGGAEVGAAGVVRSYGLIVGLGSTVTVAP